MGPLGLDLYQAKMNVPCSMTQRSNAGEAWNRNTTVSSQALYLCTP